MVGSPVLGAAVGIGGTLVLAVTVVMYCYYQKRRKAKEWQSLDIKIFNKNTIKPTYTVHNKNEFNATKQQHAIQPLQDTLRTSLELCSTPAASHSLQHQSKSYPAGGQPLLCRTPSISSQSSLESSASRQGHRGSSPQIRTFAPDGRTTIHPEASHTSSFPLRTSSRSPSPLRAASLDIRCCSPAGLCDIRTPSPSQSSLTSVTGGSASSCNSPVPPSPRGAGVSRCLSPLLIPSARSYTPDNNPAAVVPPASPLGAIQPDLYMRKEGPLFIGGSPKNKHSLGRLHFRVSYDFDKSDLVVHLIEAHDLAGSEQGGFNDPYVRLSLLPEVDSKRRQTAICRNEPNPFFDHLFKFPISHDELKSKTLLFQVFDYDRYSRNDIIGEVRMILDDYDAASTTEVWGELGKSKKPPEDMQEILISLSYLPSAERLTVVVLKAKNLISPQNKDHIDPFVKVYLIVNGKRVKKKKTVSRKSCHNPAWNEALSFSLSAANFPNAAIEICIMDQSSDLIGNNPLIGCCMIGPKENGPDRDHWYDMTQSPRKAIACWHTIRAVFGRKLNAAIYRDY